MARDEAREEALAQERLSKLDTGIPHPARVYDALLGGKDNFAADRQAAEAVARAFPAVVQSVHANRQFLDRAVTYLADEAGIRQFLDIGTGLPSANNTHDVAQRHAPEARVLYVDNDPLVLMHAKVLLTSAEPGWTGYVEADLREPAKILDRAAGLLDFGQPVGIMLLGILHYLTDEDDPYQAVRTLMDAAAPGSYLAMSHVASDINPGNVEAADAYNEQAQEKMWPRDAGECARFFEGLELVEPGLVPFNRWRPRTEAEAATYGGGWCGVARKP